MHEADVAGIESTPEPPYSGVAITSLVLSLLVCIPGAALVGLVLGVAGVMGLLAGTLVCGFAVAIFMANAGGAWDNAKKSFEGEGFKTSDGELLKKGTPAHAAAVVGDTVGDPFKDTAGPSLNILVKLMSVVALVLAPLLASMGGGLVSF